MNIRGLVTQLLIVVVLSCGLAACGTRVPDIGELWDRDYAGSKHPNDPPFSASAQIEFEIKRRIYCDLKDAVQAANKYKIYRGPTAGPVIPDDWGAQVSLTLTVSADSVLKPGISTIDPFNAVEKFMLNFGGTLSSTASRTDKFDPYWPVEYLMRPDTPTSICNPQYDLSNVLHMRTAKSSPLIRQSDLGIEDWLVGAMVVNQLLQADTEEIKAKHKKEEAITYQIKFIIVSDGDITPTWSLVRLTANNRTPLLKMGRTRTHDLIITLGPQEKTNQGKPKGIPTVNASNTHLASQIGTAVSNANKAVLSSGGFNF